MARVITFAASLFVLKVIVSLATGSDVALAETALLAVAAGALFAAFTRD